MPSNGLDAAATPDMTVDVRNTFGLDVAMSRARLFQTE